MTDRWEPKDLDELRSCVESGGASETRFCEFKQQLPSNNKEVAKKLAGFAIEGGSLVIGVAEPEPGRFEVRPIAHAGLREKVEQIAQSAVDPPLFVESRVLTDPNDGSRGVLWITVPRSSEAPHQVEGRYYERGDTQTRQMKAGAVKRLIRESAPPPPQQHVKLEEIGSKLHEVMADDPIPDGKTAHVFGVARPIGAVPEELYDAIGDDDGWPGFCEDARRSIEEYLWPPQSGPRMRPWHRLYRSGYLERDGYTVHSGWNGETGSDDYVLRMSFRDNGTITYFNNVGSYDGQGTTSLKGYFLCAELIVGSCLDVLDAARAVARRTGQPRSWDIGFGLTGTKGLREHGAPSQRFASPPFPDSSYERTAHVTPQQLETDVWGVARKLTRRFLRGCDLKFEQVARELGYQEPGDAP